MFGRSFITINSRIHPLHYFCWSCFATIWHQLIGVTFGSISYWTSIVRRWAKKNKLPFQNRYGIWYTSRHFFKSTPIPFLKIKNAKLQFCSASQTATFRSKHNPALEILLWPFPTSVMPPRGTSKNHAILLWINSGKRLHFWGFIYNFLMVLVYPSESGALPQN